MADIIFADPLSAIVAAVFAGAGIANLAGPRSLREAYVRWDLPVRYRFVTGSIGLAAAALVAGHAYRAIGMVLTVIALFLAVVKLLDRNEYLNAAVGIILLGVVWVRFLVGPL